ncbi:MAG: hypothetical protein BM557_09595 [Flavobacterium sp. MedPE-SWcel]|nr:MAG: hypothetical protein BM557_09595 [Flavobacterium sp. MedPE-SWcel]
MKNSVPFQYAYGVREGRIITGKRIKQAVDRFFRWIDEAEAKGYYLDHMAGMHIVSFFPTWLNHTKGKLQGKPFHLLPFQQFTMYNVFAWKKMQQPGVIDPINDKRRIKTVYDKRAKKNGKTAEMAGLAIYVMGFDSEMEAEVYVGATKEKQARLCWQQAKQFITSHVANSALRKIGFYAQQTTVNFRRTESSMIALDGKSERQDGINAHLAIIDEYHAHVDDTLKENLESSMVMRSQPIVWHITTAGTNVQSPCKRYEDSVIEVLEGRVELDHLFVMIHDLDEGDDWESQDNWFKANPILGQGLEVESLQVEYENAKAQPSKIPNFKTKHLNMWVDAPTVWIPNEIWQENKHNLSPDEIVAKFQEFGGYGGLDLSTNRDITALVLISNPDEFNNRYIVPFLFCPFDTINMRSKEDRVPYRAWADAGYIIATPGNVVDYAEVEEKIMLVYEKYNIERIECDKWNAQATMQRLEEVGVNVSEFSQAITVLSAPTKEFERLVYKSVLKHCGNPVMAWMLAGCQTRVDNNENIRIDKGRSNTNGRRIDGIAAAINAIGGSMSGADEPSGSVYDNPDVDFYC